MLCSMVWYGMVWYHSTATAHHAMHVLPSYLYIPCYAYCYAMHVPTCYAYTLGYAMQSRSAMLCAMYSHAVRYSHGPHRLTTLVAERSGLGRKFCSNDPSHPRAFIKNFFSLFFKIMSIRIVVFFFRIDVFLISCIHFVKHR